MTKSVMIVDDHPAIRVAIRALLSQSNEFSTIYELMVVKPWKH